MHSKPRARRQADPVEIAEAIGWQSPESGSDDQAKARRAASAAAVVWRVVVVVEVVERLVEPAVGHPEVELGRRRGRPGSPVSAASSRSSRASVQAAVTSAIAASAIRSWTYCRSRIASRCLIRTPLDRPGEPRDAAGQGVGVRAGASA